MNNVNIYGYNEILKLMQEALSGVVDKEFIFFNNYNNGFEPTDAEEKPFSTDTLFVVFNYNIKNTVISDDNILAYFKLKVVIFGNDCDYAMAKMKKKLASEEFRILLRNTKYNLLRAGVDSLPDYELYGQTWYRKTTSEFILNHIIEDKQEIAYFEKLNKLTVKEV